MRSVIRMSSIGFATLLLSLLVFASQSVQAAPTVINTANAGAGSLRQAILDAITASAATTIDFNIPTTDPGYNGSTFTITLLTALPNLPLAPLTINNAMGKGVIVTTNGGFRIFTLVNSAVVVINNLTISHGNTGAGVGDGAKGGGIFMGNSATLTLNNCVVSDSTATNGGGGIWINNSGVLFLNDTAISNNTTTGGDGGGIRMFDSTTLNITRTTVSGNHAPVGGGGGIYNGVSGTVTANNITVNGNTAGTLGGGINNSQTPATATINSSTISGNTATTGGGGILNGPTSTATLSNSLVALNTGAGSPDLLGGFTGSSNLIGNADGSTGLGAGNQLGTTLVPINPKLGPLQGNGGPTFTQALLPGSPAIDAGATALPTDQRGVSRPQDGDGVGGAQADIGSYESRGALEPPPPPTPTPTPTPSTPTLQFDASVYTVQEGCTFVTGHVLRTGPSGTAVSVDVTSDDGSAKQKGDYEIVLAHLVFGAGETDKTFQVLINDDGYTEGLEVAILLLQRPVGGVLGIPSTAGLQITDNLPETSSNPIDLSSDFVGQHYHDFLYRQADQAGQDFWTNGIESCGADATCRQAKRVDVSTAFFLSIEFQQTGYFVIRAYKAAFGNVASNPRYTVFLRDQLGVGNGVIVGQGSWEAQLETNKQNYLSDFVSRPEFVALFPLGGAAATYVDNLFLNAGATPTITERSAAITAYGSGNTSGRVAALKSVIESGSLFNAQYNQAFVLMQYYGYLRRNPDDAPDNNFNGYNFWLTKMNSFTLPGEDARNESVALARVRRAEMVKAFIVSTEYRERFFGAAGGNQQGTVEIR